MRKIFISLTTSFFIITILFLSCKKNETTYSPENEAFIEQTKNWFNSSFVNTEEYKNGTTNGNFKKPNWNLGIIYYIGKTQVAEFPLITGRKKVYISETLSESDSRKIIDNTIFKVLFVKAPNKPMEVRIIQFTPTLNYLKSKNFDLSNLSFKDYTKDFKGDFMIFDFDNNFKKGYHFANDGIKTIKLQTKFLNKNNTANVPLLDVTTTSSSDLCDNSIELESNCWYIVHTTYETICTGGWNLDEGFNPNYCHIEIVSISCELAYCDNTIDFENCLNQGNTQEQCLCTLYGIGCGESGGDENGQCNMTVAEAQDILSVVVIEHPDLVEYDEGPEFFENGIIRKSRLPRWHFAKIKVIDNFILDYFAVFEGVVFKTTSSNSFWKWEDGLKYKDKQRIGTLPICVSEEMNVIVAEPVISSDRRSATSSLTYVANISIKCIAGWEIKTYTGNREVFMQAE